MTLNRNKRQLWIRLLFFWIMAAQIIFIAIVVMYFFFDLRINVLETIFYILAVPSLIFLGGFFIYVFYYGMKFRKRGL